VEIYSYVHSTLYENSHGMLNFQGSVFFYPPIVFTEGKGVIREGSGCFQAEWLSWDSCSQVTGQRIQMHAPDINSKQNAINFPHLCERYNPLSSEIHPAWSYSVFSRWDVSLDNFSVQEWHQSFPWRTYSRVSPMIVVSNSVCCLHESVVKLHAVYTDFIDSFVEITVKRGLTTRNRQKETW